MRRTTASEYASISVQKVGKDPIEDDVVLGRQEVVLAGSPNPAAHDRLRRRDDLARQEVDGLACERARPRVVRVVDEPVRVSRLVGDERSRVRVDVSPITPLPATGVTS